MNAKQISLILLTLIAYTNMHSMEKSSQKISLPEGIEVEGISFGIEEIWLNIIAQSDKKWELREVCKNFRDFASVKNEKIWQQNPLVVDKNLMEQCALYYADLDSAHIVINLLDQGLDANIGNPKFLLYYAAKNENIPLITKLLNPPHFMLDNNSSVDARLKIAFIEALDYNCHEAAKQILTASKNNKELLSQLIFLYNGHKTNSSNHCTDITMHIVTSIQDYSSNSLFEQSCEDGVIKSVIALLSFTKYEANILAAALYRAVEKGHTRIAKILIEHGADVNAIAPCRSRTPLKAAILQQHVNCIRLLIDQGATIVTPSRKEPLLLYAIQTGFSGDIIRKQVIELLLSKGADPNEKISLKNSDYNGKTPYDYASDHASSIITSLFIKYGAKRYYYL